MTEIRDSDGESFSIVDSNKVYVHVEHSTELVTFLVSERLFVQAFLGYIICDQFVEFIFPKTRSVELREESTLDIIRHYGEQETMSTTNHKFLQT